MKRKHYLLIAALSLSLTAGVCATTLAACGDKTEKVQITESVTGTYYFDDNGTERTISLDLTSFKLDFGAGEKAGVYTSYEGGTLFLTFDNSETATAVFNSGILTLNYNGKTYTMYQKKTYTVAFNTDGGSAVAAQPVMNGKKATCPADNPTRNNSVFIDWYKDSAFKNKFDFNEIITSDTTVYAKFVTIDAKLGVFEAKFDLGDGVDDSYDAVETVNRRLYHLPELADKNGNKFLGWWMSNYYDAAKLSSKYEEQEIYEDVVLHAVWASDTPAVSVTPEGANWSVNGTNKTFDVVIKNANGDTLKEQQSGATSIEYDFANAKEGDYTVEVTVDKGKASEKTATAYYKNKALARVADFEVDGDFLGFVPIETEHSLVKVTYYMDLECGSEGHTHVHQKLNGAGFDFSDCDMKKGGIRFRITAEAVDYAASVSEWFSLERNLDQVGGLVVNDDETITWNAVDNVKSYYLEFFKDGATTAAMTASVKTNSYDMRTFARGSWKITVKPVNNTYNMPEATETTFNKTRLSSPTLSVEGNNITWNKVDGAAGYELSVNGVVKQTFDANTNTCVLTNDVLGEMGEKGYAVTVAALGATEDEKSLASKASYIHGELGEISYADGTVTWDAVFGITKYGVKVGGAAEFFVNTNSAAITFAAAGSTEIKVTCYDGDDEAAGTPQTIVLTVVTAKFDTLGGTAFDSQYKVSGDTLELPEEDPERRGYTFVGWFNQAENGSEYKDKTLVFDSAKPTIYANWTANKYTVTLSVDSNGTLSGTKEFEVTFGEMFELPVPTCLDETEEFSGWFTAKKGGTCFTDNLGSGQNVWNMDQDTTLYAHWGAAAVSYELRTDGKGYIASKGPGVNSLETVSVLATYKGLPVTDLMSNAFSGCATIKTLRLPSSLQNVVIPSGGPYVSGSSFYGLSGLEKIEVYDVEGEKFLAAVDGSLYTLAGGDLDALIFVPKKSDITSFTVADGAKTISAKALTSASNLAEVVIPASVTYIGESAFSSSKKLKTVTFLPAANGQIGHALEIAKSAFSYCDGLEEITLPKRLTTIGEDAFYVSTSSGALAKIYIQELGAIKDKKTNFYDMDGVLCKGDQIVRCPQYYAGEYNIPTGITKIGEKAFKGCTKLTGVNFTGLITRIGAEAFSGCSGLLNIAFDGSASNEDLEICEKAFYGCSKLESVTLPPNLKTLGVNAFQLTSKLTTVTVNSNRSSVDYAADAFGTTTYVTTLNIGKDAPLFDFVSIFGNKLTEVTVDEANPNYKEDDGIVYSSNYSKIIFSPANKTEFVFNNVEIISARLFKGNTTLTSVTIGKNVREIEASAFENCTNLTTVLFEAGGTQSLKIGDSAFYKCNKINSLTFNGRDGAEITIGEKAFASTISNANDLKMNLVLPEGVTSIGKFAFAACHGIKSVSFPSTLKSVGMQEVGDLTGITASTKIEEIGVAGTSIFDTTWYMDSLTVSKDNPNFVAIDNVLYTKENGVPKTLLYVPCKNQAAEMPDEFKDPEATGEQLGYLEIPATVDKIADRAFYNQGYEGYNKPPVGIKRVVFKGAVALGIGAFESSALETVDLPDGIEEIPQRCFKSTISLKAVNIPNTVTSIRIEAFKGCTALEDLTFATGNDSAKLILEDGSRKSTSTGGQPSYTTYGVFSGCRKLGTVEFPARLKELGAYAFADSSGTTASYTNSALKKVRIPATVEKIGNYAFSACSALEDFAFFGTVDSAKSMTIGEFAFQNCSKVAKETGTGTNTVKTFELPDSVVSIGNSAFIGTGLTKFVVPARLETLGSLGLPSTLETVEFKTMEENGKQVNKLKSFEVFKNYKKLKSVNLEVCTSLDALPATAFQNCVELTSITVPSCVTSVGANAFNGCTKLETITFAKTGEYETVTEIGDYAFKGTGITAYTFPTLETGSLTLGKNLFENCNLTTLTITRSVQEIGSALAGANADEIITLEGAGVVKDETYKMMLSLVSAENQTYKIISTFGAVPLDGNGTFAIPSSYKGGAIVEIGDNAFLGQMAMKKVVIPESVQMIGANAFSGCRGLETVEFAGASSLSSIGNAAFAETYSLRDVVLPNSVTSIGYRAFYNSGIRSVTMPKRLRAVGRQIFYACSILETVNKIPKMTLSATNELDGCQMFYQCYGLKNVTISEDAEILPSALFEDCTSLESIDLTGITQFANKGSSAPTDIFSDCINLHTVTLDADLKNLPSDMFENCKSLTTVYRSDTPEEEREEGYIDLSQITSLTKPFSGCIAMKKVNISGVTSFGSTSGIFSGCTALEKVVLASAGYTTLPSNMFENCSALKTVQHWNEKQGFVGAENEVTLHNGVNFLGTTTFKNSGIEKVNIPDSAKVIAYNAAGNMSSASNCFQNCTALTTVVFPNGFTKIGRGVFNGCTSLVNLSIKGDDSNKIVNGVGKLTGIDELGESAFEGCTSLVNIEFSDVTKTGSKAFKSCTGLTTAKFNKIEVASNLGTNMFELCTNLSSVSLDKAKTISASCFSGCTSLTAVSFPAATELGNYAFSKSGLTSTVEKPLQMPNVTKIGNYAFQNCAGLIAVELKGIKTTKTGTHVFKDCVNLISVKMDNATAFGNNVFDGCSALASVSFPAATEFGGSMFRSCPNLTSVTAPKLEKIGDSCFASRNITTADFPKVTSLGKSAFKDCAQLVSANIVAAGTIGESAFDGCTQLKSVDLSGAATINRYAFRSCTALTEIDIPKVTTIMYDAFNGCTKLETVKITGKLTSIGDSAFEGCKSLTAIYRTDLLTAPTADEGTEETTPVIPQKANLSGVTSIGEYAFDGCAALTEVELNANGGEAKLTAIQAGTFDGCGQLSKITLPAGLTEIGDGAFQNCVNLTAFEIPASVEEIGSYVFAGCDGLTLSLAEGNETFILKSNGWLVQAEKQGTGESQKTVETVFYIPRNAATGEGGAMQEVTEIAFAEGTRLVSDMFTGYSWVTKIAMPADMGVPTGETGKETVKNPVPEGLFRDYAGGFTDFAFPAGITEITDSMFERCAGLTEIVIPEGVTSIGDYAFRDCKNLTKITLPASLTEIGQRAFAGCTSLSEIAGPETGFPVHYLEKDEDAKNFKGGLSVGYGAFMGCVGFTGEVELPDGIVYIGSHCFDGCTGVTKLTLGNHLNEIGINAFENCTALTSVVFNDFSEKRTATSTSGVQPKIGKEAFKNTGLTTVEFKGATPNTVDATSFGANRSAITFTMGDRITSIPDNIFTGNTNITSFEIPHTVSYIGAHAFEGCTNLANVTFETTPTGTDPVRLTIGGGSTKIYDPAKDEGVYKFIDDLGYGYSGAFVGTKITSLTLPDRGTEARAAAESTETVTKTMGISIGAYAFAGLNLAAVTLPTGVSTVGAGAFYGTNLTGITIPYTVTSIGTSAFGMKLENVTFQDTPTGTDPVFLTLENGNKGTKLTAGLVYKNGDAEEYYSGAFVGTKITSLTLPARVKSVGKCAFAFTSLESVNVNGAMTLGDYAFCGNKSLTSVTIPESNAVVTTGTGDSATETKIQTTLIDSYCFEGCIALSQIQIASTVAEIDSYAFKNCTALMNIVIPVSTKLNSSKVFEGWTAEQKVQLNVKGKEYFSSAVAWNTYSLEGTKATIEVVSVPEE